MAIWLRTADPARRGPWHEMYHADPQVWTMRCGVRIATRRPTDVRDGDVPSVLQGLSCKACVHKRNLRKAHDRERGVNFVDRGA